MVGTQEKQTMNSHTGSNLSYTLNHHDVTAVAKIITNAVVSSITDTSIGINDTDHSTKKVVNHSSDATTDISHARKTIAYADSPITVIKNHSEDVISKIGFCSQIQSHTQFVHNCSNKSDTCYKKNIVRQTQVSLEDSNDSINGSSTQLTTSLQRQLDENAASQAYDQHNIDNSRQGKIDAADKSWYSSKSLMGEFRDTIFL